jgi:hypothetical protein
MILAQTPGSDIIVAVDTTDTSTLQNAVDTINDGSGAQGFLALARQHMALRPQSIPIPAL